MDKAVLLLLGRRCCHRWLWFCLAIVVLLIIRPVAAKMQRSNVASLMQGLVASHINTLEAWSQDSRLVKAVVTHNNKQMPMAVVKLLDTVWLDDVASNMVASLDNNFSKKVLHRKMMNRPVFVDAVLCDQQGVVVGQFPSLSDYWRGDETSFTQSYANGRGQVVIGSPRFNDATQQYQVLVSLPVYQNAKAVGVLMVTLVANTRRESQRVSARLR